MKNKRIHIEALRIIAIYMVMFNHTGAEGFFYFANHEDSPLYFFYMLASIFCKIAVPLFFMITGALLLEKNESLKSLFVKRILKYVIVLIGFSILYYWYLGKGEMTAQSIFRAVYSTSTTSGLWYLYSYLGILLMLPILSKVAQHLTEKEYIYLFVCQIVLVGIIPIIQYLVWKGEVTINPSFSAMIFTTDNVFYLLMGYYVEHGLDENKVKRREILLLCLGSIIALIMSCVVTHYRSRVMGYYSQAESQAFHTALISIPTFTVYVLMKKMCQKDIPQWLKKWIVTLGGSVFGAYLFEKIIRSFTAVIYGGLNDIIGCFWASVLWTVFGMTVGLFLVTVLKKVPFLGKYISKII